MSFEYASAMLIVLLWFLVSSEVRYGDACGTFYSALAVCGISCFPVTCRILFSSSVKKCLWEFGGIGRFHCVVESFSSGYISFFFQCLLCLNINFSLILEIFCYNFIEHILYLLVVISAPPSDWCIYRFGIVILAHSSWVVVVMLTVISFFLITVQM